MAKFLNKTNVIGLVVIIALVAWTFFIYGGPTTGQVTANAVQQIPAQPSQNVQNVIAKPGAMPAGSDQTQVCNQKSAGLTGQAKTDAVATCMSYYNKVCFSNSQCGPFSCVASKCQ